MRELEVFFDYECPYCKLGHEMLLRLLSAHPDISVTWRPCEAHPRPEDHPPHTDLCLQGLFYVMETGGDVLAYHRRMYNAVHTDHIDVEDAQALAACADGLVDADAFLAALRDGRYARVQAEGNDYAYEQSGVWYLPAFRMEGRRLDSAGGVGVTEAQLADFLGVPVLKGVTSPLGSKRAQGYTYVAALSRFEGKLLLSRRADCETWETQGGHIEPGEMPLAAMRRELFEECGAAEYALYPVCDYSAAGTHGMFFFADIAALGPLPKSEMAEVRLFAALPPPQALTYPGITPVLYDVVRERF